MVKWGAVVLALAGSLLLGCASAVSAAGPPRFSAAPGSPVALPTYGASPEFSPSGRLLAVWSEGVDAAGHPVSAVTLFTVAPDGRLRRLPGSLIQHNRDFASLGPFSPDGRYVVVCDGHNGDRLNVYSVDRNGLGKRRFSAHIPNVYCDASFSSDGKLLALDDAGLGMYSVAANGSLHRIPGSPFPVLIQPALAFSPTGSYLAALGDAPQDHTLALYSVGVTGAPSAAPVTLVHAGHSLNDLAFSPSGGLLAAVSYSNSLVQVYTVGPGPTLSKAPGGPRLTEPAGLPQSPAFSPDGKLLALADVNTHNVVVFSVAADGALRRKAVVRSARSNHLGPTGVAFSPDGKLLAVANRADGTVAVFSVR